MTPKGCRQEKGETRAADTHVQTEETQAADTRVQTGETRAANICVSNGRLAPWVSTEMRLKVSVYITQTEKQF